MLLGCLPACVLESLLRLVLWPGIAVVARRGEVPGTTMIIDARSLFLSRLTMHDCSAATEHCNVDSNRASPDSSWLVCCGVVRVHRTKCVT